jgi:hypothetical protein
MGMGQQSNDVQGFGGKGIIIRRCWIIRRYWGV